MWREKIRKHLLLFIIYALKDVMSGIARDFEEERKKEKAKKKTLDKRRHRDTVSKRGTEIEREGQE